MLSWEIFLHNACNRDPLNSMDYDSTVVVILLGDEVR